MHVLSLLAALSLEMSAYQSATTLVDRAIARRAVPLAPLSFHAEGSVRQLRQSRQPGEPYLETRLEQTTTADPAARRFLHDETSVWPYFTSRTTLRLDGSELLTLRHSNRTHQLSTGGAESFAARMIRRHPDLLLDAASRQRTTLRLVAPDTFRFVAPDSTVLTARLAQERVVSAEWLTYDQLLGDVAHRIEYEWSDGQPVAMQQFENDQLVLRVRYREIARGARVQMSAVEIPKGYTPAAQVAVEKPAIVELGSDVFLIRNAGGADYHSLLVRFSDRFVVVEAPRSTAAAKATIAAIRAFDATRPIAAVVVTHHHEDHIGGLRAYAEAGVQIVAAAGNVAYLRSLLATPHTIEPSPRVDPLLLAVPSQHRIADETNQLELLDVGPTDHAVGMLVAWLPRQRILFQGDLFRYDPGTPEPARDSAVVLSKFIAERRLRVATIAGVHGEPAEAAQLDAAVARRAD